MENKNIIIIIGLLIIIIGVGGYFYIKPTNKSNGAVQSAVSQNTVQNTEPKNLSPFKGEKGISVTAENGIVSLPADIFSDNQARFYNIELSGKTIYFFVVKDKNGFYRAAANACAVCFKTYKGFRQEGNEIVCNNCGNRYAIEKIATEKGGCNPGPINPNLEVKNGKIVIKLTDIEQVSELF